jgi:hypothetical protein
MARQLRIEINCPRALPRTKNPMLHDSLMDGYELQYIRSATPPVYDFAPASRLLTRDPEIGIDLVLKLSNFATDKWAESWLKSQAEFYGADKSANDVPRLTLDIDGKQKEFLGDAKVFA